MTMRPTRHPTVVSSPVTCCVCLDQRPAGDTMWWDIDRSTFACDPCQRRPDLVPVHHHQPHSPLAELGLVDAFALTDRVSPDQRQRLDALYVAPTGIWVIATPAGGEFTRARRAELRIDAAPAEDPFDAICADIAARHPRLPLHRVVVAPTDAAVTPGPFVAELGRSRVTVTGPSGLASLITRTGPLDRHQASRVLRDLAEAFPPHPDTPARDAAGPSRARLGFFATQAAQAAVDAATPAESEPTQDASPTITLPTPAHTAPPASVPSITLAPTPTSQPPSTPIALNLPQAAPAAASPRPRGLFAPDDPHSAPAPVPTFQAAPSNDARPVWKDVALACVGVQVLLAPIWALGFWKGWVG